jgi:hypothetical protein
LNSFLDDQGTSHTNENIHKNIGASAGIKIADTTASIKEKWRSHTKYIRRRVALSQLEGSTIYKITSKEIQI